MRSESVVIASSCTEVGKRRSICCFALMQARLNRCSKVMDESRTELSQQAHARIMRLRNKHLLSCTHSRK
eukprot:scaffold16200_cov21-Tisochrysis_lutea.AAC.1